jgi:flagellar biosynthesis/type III secretory pathway chaperone
MTVQERTNSDYLDEMEALLSRFATIVEIENVALERRDTATLQRLTADKSETSKQVEKLWREFRPRLAEAGEADHEKFLAVNRHLAELQPLLKRNMKLLTAAKICTATRIEAGVEAWHQAQRDQAVEYGSNGRISSGRAACPAKPDHLI